MKSITIITHHVCQNNKISMKVKVKESVQILTHTCILISLHIIQFISETLFMFLKVCYKVIISMTAYLVEKLDRVKSA